MVYMKRWQNNKIATASISWRVVSEISCQRTSFQWFVNETSSYRWNAIRTVEINITQSGAAMTDKGSWHTDDNNVRQSQYVIQNLSTTGVHSPACGWSPFSFDDTSFVLCRREKRRILQLAYDEQKQARKISVSRHFQRTCWPRPIYRRRCKTLD